MLLPNPGGCLPTCCPNVLLSPTTSGHSLVLRKTRELISLWLLISAVWELVAQYSSFPACHRRFLTYDLHSLSEGPQRNWLQLPEWWLPHKSLFIGFLPSLPYLSSPLKVFLGDHLSNKLTCTQIFFIKSALGAIQTKADTS